MNLIEKICALFRHPFRRLMRCDVHPDYSRTRFYSCRVCGKVIREDERGSNV